MKLLIFPAEFREPGSFSNGQGKKTLKCLKKNTLNGIKVNKIAHFIGTFNEYLALIERPVPAQCGNEHRHAVQHDILTCGHIQSIYFELPTLFFSLSRLPWHCFGVDH